jgi:hypothetical protein
LGALDFASGGINLSSDNNEQMRLTILHHSRLQMAQNQVSKTLHDKSSVVRFSKIVVVLVSGNKMCKNGDIAAVLSRINFDYQPHR